MTVELTKSLKASSSRSKVFPIIRYKVHNLKKSPVEDWMSG